MRIILTRHGETEENVQGILQGHMPGTLTKDGILQAKKLALRLKDAKIDAIFSSDLKRAADTAREIAAYHKGVPLIFTEELREGDMGSATGMHKSKIQWDKRPVGMESWESMLARAKSFIDKIYKDYPDKTVLFVSHGGISRSFVLAVTGRPADEFEQVEAPKNTAVSIFDIEEDRSHRVHLLNCTKHLD